MCATDRANSAGYRWPRRESDAGIFVGDGNIPAAQGPVSTPTAEVRQVPTSLQHDARLARTLAPIFVAVVFWVHMFVPAGVAVPALYVVPILLFIRTGRFWEPLLVAVSASAATIAGPYLPHAGGSMEIDRLNLPLELAIVWLSAGAVAYHRVTSDRWSRQIVR